MLKRFSQLINIFLALILFLALNILSNQLLVNFRIDMTEDRLYTLSNGTKQIINGIQEPIDMTLYFSVKGFSGFPDLQSHGNLARDMLEEYAAYSRGRLRLSVVDPEPFSQTEDEARANGIRQISLGTNTAGYLGLVAANSTDGKIVMPLLQPEEETNLEYDFSKLLADLVNPRKKRLGLITTLPLLGLPSQQINPDRETKTWAIFEVLKENFEVVPIKFDTPQIPEELDVLLVVHPKNLPESTTHALDQYVLGGGKLIMFIDPLAEGDPTSPDPTTPGVLPNLSSNPKQLLERWGIRMVDKKIIVDPSSAVKVNFGTPDGPRKIIYLPWLQIRDTHINEKEIFTRGLSVLNVGTAGSLQITDEKSNLTYKKLFAATANSGLIASETIIQVGNPTELFDLFQGDDLSHTIALQVSGMADSYLRNEETANNRDNKRDSGQADKLTSGKIDVLVVADTDILSDRFWTDPRSYLSTGEIQPFSSNADFLINAIDLYGGGGELINLRTRGRYSRPFEIVEKLRRDAESEYRDQERELKIKLKETEDRLIALENSSGNGIILSAEQKSEIDRFRSEQKNTRKELRAVQHKLIKDIEQLGSAMKFVNTGLVPLFLLGLGGLNSLRKIYS